MKAKKTVLISESGYDKKHDRLLESLLDEGYELFCAVGRDCELWEDAMDEICVGDGNHERFIVTTSHPNETEEDVIEFARSYETDSGAHPDVRIIRINASESQCR